MKLKEYPSAFYAYLGKNFQNWEFRKKLRKQMERLQAYVDTHPRKSVVAILGTMVLMLLLTLVTTYYDFTNSANEEVLPIQSIEEMSSIFSNKQRLDEIKQNHVEEVRSIFNEGQLLRKNLDSLMSLREKTHADSLEIYRQHKQLSTIVHYLNDETD
jgi:hypothetical protein